MSEPISPLVSRAMLEGFLIGLIVGIGLMALGITLGSIL